jgi:DNA polymerase III subunit epsilon
MPPVSPPRVSSLRAFGSPREVRHPFEGKTDTRRRRKLKDVARTLPRAPGVYFFYGFDDRLLYVGKAKCLRERVGSYFGETAGSRPPKLRRLLAEIKRLEWQECGSELEALLLERRLIAECLPILNRQHKRFEVYPYLLLSDEAFPRLTLTRSEPAEPGARRQVSGASEVDVTAAKTWNQTLDTERRPLETPPRAGELPGLYLGPFTSPRAAAWTFEAVRALFPLRSCEGDIVPDADGHACFYHDIGRCCGPCVGAVAREEYARLCADLIQLLQTGQAAQLDALRARMRRLSDEWRFEDAAKLKEQLQAIEIVAARLQRLNRMRQENNVVIVQPARCDTERDGDAERSRGESENRVAACSTPTLPRAAVFLVRGGVVRRHLVVGSEAEWKGLRHAMRDVFAAPPPPAAFTAKAELDEMMILDRWLKVHRDEACCVWMNERSSRQWMSSAIRQLQDWAKQGK